MTIKTLKIKIKSWKKRALYRKQNSTSDCYKRFEIDLWSKRGDL